MSLPRLAQVASASARVRTKWDGGNDDRSSLPPSFSAHVRTNERATYPVKKYSPFSLSSSSCHTFKVGGGEAGTEREFVSVHVFSSPFLFRPTDEGKERGRGGSLSFRRRPRFSYVCTSYPPLLFLSACFYSVGEPPFHLSPDVALQLRTKATTQKKVLPSSS